MKISFGLKVLPVAALFATGAIAAPPPPPATYVMKAGASDLYEKQSSQLVLASSKNPQIRQFAQMMVTDHGKSTAEVKAAAMKSGLTPKPPMLDPEQKAMIAKLTAAKGTARDTLYVQQQMAAHNKALMLQQDFAAGGSAPALKDTASSIVPVVQHHLDMLKAMPSA